LAKQALSTEIPTNFLVINLLSDLDENEIHGFKKLNTIQRRIQLLRQKQLLSSTSNDDDIPEDFKTSCSGKQFLLYNEHVTIKNRILIFVNKENLVHLKNSSTWLADGTFYSSPRGFLIVYVLYCNIFDKHFPILYCLLQNKSYTSYEKMFSIIKSLTNGRGPRYMIMDFETAPLNAFKSNFCSTKFLTVFSILDKLCTGVFAKQD
jgi:hypothetical protein